MHSRAILATALLTWAACVHAAHAQLAFRPTRLASRSPNAEPAALPIAAGGYCVVTLRDQRAWQPGEPPFGAQFDGRQYWFAGQRELEIFAAAPSVYAPVLSGDCVVTYAETGKRIAGRSQFGVAQGGRMYFFASDAMRAKFVAAPEDYANADVADGGICLVTRVERRRDVAGLPDAAVLVGGLRRLFAGAHERSLYLADPLRYNAVSVTPGTPLPMGAVLSSDPLADRGDVWRRAATPAPSDANAPAEDDQAESDMPGGDEILPDPVMGGYCPVSIRQKQLWVRGRYDDYAQVESMIFHTAGPAERDAFVADPARYIPALGGNCVVSFVDRGEKVRGSVFHASQYQERLFLFADAEAKATFDAGPARYASIDLAAGGACVVTLAETGQPLPGFGEFAAWYEGLLYRFASAEKKAKFLAAPTKYAAIAAAAPPAPPATTDGPAPTQ